MIAKIKRDLSNVISLTGVTHLGDHYGGERCMAVGAGDGVNCLVLMIKLRVGRGRGRRISSFAIHQICSRSW